MRNFQHQNRCIYRYGLRSEHYSVDINCDKVRVAPKKRNRYILKVHYKTETGTFPSTIGAVQVLRHQLERRGGSER